MSEKTVATVQLDSPITRGDTTITEVVLRKPQSGALRGTRLQAVMEMDVASMMTVIPRISTPTLTPQERYAAHGGAGVAAQSDNAKRGQR